jgi:hypothetical protein
MIAEVLRLSVETPHSFNAVDCESSFRAQRLQLKCFSLNIAFAVTSVLFIYEGGHHLADAPKFIQSCLEGFARWLAYIAPLAFHQHRKVDFLHSELIREVVFLGLTLAIAFLLYVPVLLLTRGSASRAIFAPLSGVAALVAVPSCWLYILRATWNTYYEPKTFAETYGLVSVLEVIITCALVYFVRNQPIWRGAVVFGLHYIFWMLLLFRHLSIPLVGLPLSFVFPGSGVVWLRYIRALPSQTLP